MGTVFNYDEANPQLMYYKLDSDKEFDNISVEMIRCNQKSMNSLLPVHFVTENGEISRIEYDLTGMKTLKSYLEKFAINKKRFVELAEKILNNLESCSRHMLPSSQIYLEQDKIYLDIATMKVSLLCVPVKEITEPYDLKKFFIGLMESIYLDVDSEHESVDFQTIYDMLPNQNLTIELMRENLELLQHGKKEKQPAPVQSSPSRSIPAAAAPQPSAALVDVVQENRYSAQAAGVNNVKPEKKNNLLKSVGSGSSKEEKKHKEDKKQKKPAASSDLMSMFRKTQNNSAPAEKQAQPAPKYQAASPVPSSANSGRTVLILHEDPDETAYLIYGSQKIRIDAEGTSVGRLGGSPGQKVNVFLDSIHVSSYHGVISYDFDNMYYTVTDYSSTGTTLNGVRIQKKVPVQLHHNDMLIFGDVPCRILLENNNLS